MAYSVQADIEKRIPAADVAALTDDTNGVTTNTGILDEQIALADALIDSYLRGKHTVPLTASPIPTRVRGWSENLSIFNLYKRRLDLAIPETLKAQQEMTIEQLKMVQEGTLLIDDTASSANTATYIKTNKTADSRIFNQNDEENGTLDHFFSKHRITPGGVH